VAGERQWETEGDAERDLPPRLAQHRPGLPQCQGQQNPRPCSAQPRNGCGSFIREQISGTNTSPGVKAPLMRPGLPPTGRATIAALRLNREGSLNWRRALKRAGNHPPPDRSSLE